VKIEIKSRREPCYPPFSHVVNIISSDESEGAAKARLDHLAMLLAEAIAKQPTAHSLSPASTLDENETGGQNTQQDAKSVLPQGTELLGPVDCPLARVKNKYRFHLMLRDRNRPRLHDVLKVYDRLAREEREGLIVDVDAHSML
jgi:primosomal protein N' (replication factor Y)